MGALPDRVKTLAVRVDVDFFPSPTRGPTVMATRSLAVKRGWPGRARDEPGHDGFGMGEVATRPAMTG